MKHATGHSDLFGIVQKPSLDVNVLYTFSPLFLDKSRSLLVFVNSSDWRLRAQGLTEHKLWHVKFCVC